MFNCNRITTYGIDTYFVRLILNYLYKLAMEQPELYYSCSFFFYRYLLILHDWFGITYNDHETIQIIIYYSRINSLVLVFNRKIASFLRNIFYCSTFYCLLSFICIRSHYHVLCDHAGKPHHIKRYLVSKILFCTYDYWHMYNIVVSTLKINIKIKNIKKI